MFGDYGNFMGGMHAFGWLFWVALLGLLWMVVRPRSRSDSPLRILQRRFARGEITAEQYAQAKAVLDRDDAED